jgi:glycosyltransferase involved in cell wall biosynthesis
MQLLAPLTLAGAERVVLNQLRYLDPARFEQHVFLQLNARRPDDLVAAEVRKLGIEPETYHLERLFDWQQVREVAGALKRHKIDILHTHGYRTDVIGYLATRSSRVPRVSTVHGWIANTRRAHVYHFLQKLALRHFDHVIAVSDDIRDRLLRCGLRPERVVKIGNTVDLAALSRLNGDRPRGGETVVGTVGRLSPEKGLTHFLQAAREVLNARDDVRFLLIGDGPQREELAGLARALGIEDRVHFAGFVPEPAEIYAALDIFVLPSLSEGMPISLLEAFAAGRPCVATSVGGVVELLGRDGLGLMVPPADAKALAKAILSLLNSPSLAAEMARRARQQVVAEYSPGPWARRIEQVYASLAPGRVTSAGANS